jgi:hypothetical protein
LRSAGIARRRVVRLELVAPQGLDARDALLARQPVQRVLRRIDAAHRLLRRAGGGLVLLLPDRADHPLLLLLELLLGEGRRDEHLDQDVEQEVGVARERRSGDVDADGIRGVGGERQARGPALESLGELELGAPRRALEELAGRDGGDEAPVRRREEAPGAERARDRERRVHPVLEHVHVRAVWERAVAHPLGERGAGRRRRGGGHVGSSSPAADPASPVFGT